MSAHYLNAIRQRLDTLYALSANDPRLRERISDEVDWIDAQLEQSTEPGVTAAAVDKLTVSERNQIKKIKAHIATVEYRSASATYIHQLLSIIEKLAPVSRPMQGGQHD